MSAEQLVLLLEYDGSFFHGSQAQAKRLYSTETPMCLTVQEAVLQAVSWLGADAEVLRCLLASRTDAGVHARSQVVQLTVTPQFFERYRSPRLQLNAAFKQLAYPMMVRAVEHLCDDDFHIRNRTKWRWYRYGWHAAVGKTPFVPQGCTLLHQPLNAERMHEAAQYLCGTHDFLSFKSIHTEVPDTVCTLASLCVTQVEPNTVYLDVVGNRFLYRMVRNIAGLLQRVGEPSPRLQSDDVRRILIQQDRHAYRATAPSSGLTLMSMLYPLDSDTCLFEQDYWIQCLKTKVTNTSHLVMES
jgi:tRNA pseudouridine38-40 synthase